MCGRLILLIGSASRWVALDAGGAPRPTDAFGWR